MSTGEQKMSTGEQPNELHNPEESDPEEANLLDPTPIDDDEVERIQERDIWVSEYLAGEGYRLDELQDLFSEDGFLATAEIDKLTGSELIDLILNRFPHEEKDNDQKEHDQEEEYQVERRRERDVEAFRQLHDLGYDIEDIQAILEPHNPFMSEPEAKSSTTSELITRILDRFHREEKKSEEKKSEEKEPEEKEPEEKEHYKQEESEEEESEEEESDEEESEEKEPEEEESDDEHYKESDNEVEETVEISDDSDDEESNWKKHFGDDS